MSADAVYAGLGRAVLNTSAPENSETEFRDCDPQDSREHLLVNAAATDLRPVLYLEVRGQSETKSRTRSWPLLCSCKWGATYMGTFSKILFPIDFSERCNAFAPQVAAVAQRTGASISIMHVAAVHTHIYGGLDAYCEVLDDSDYANRAKECLETFCADFTKDHGLEVSSIFEQGDPASIITATPAQTGIDLVMMPTHGCGPFRRYLIGSVTAKVLHDCNVPVWTAAHDDEAPVRGLANRHIVCAIELEPHAAELIRRSADVASALESDLVLLHAVPGAEVSPYDFGADFRAFLFRTARERISELQSQIGTNFPLCLHAGKVPLVIREAARNHHADLVIIGRTKMHGVLGGLRTEAYGIINEAPCSVLSF